MRIFGRSEQRTLFPKESLSMKRTLTLILIIAAGTGSIIALVRFIRMDSLAFAWALNFLLMMFVQAFTETMKSPLTSGYYNARSWEQQGKIYENLGINIFRKLLVWVGWEKLTRKSNPVGKNTDALMQLSYGTKKSELGHLIIFWIVLGFTIVVAARFGVAKSLWLFILNILLNVYPVFLQRFNRPRIERAIRISKRS